MASGTPFRRGHVCVLSGKGLLGFSARECVDRVNAIQQLAGLCNGVPHPFEMGGVLFFEDVRKTHNSKKVIHDRHPLSVQAGARIGLSATDAYGQSLGR